MDLFTPLRIVSGYSFLQSGLTQKKIYKALLSADYLGAGIADNCVLYGLPEFVETLTSLNKKYILGAHFLVDEYDLTFYIKNEEGYRHLIKINSLYQKNNLSLDTIKEYLSDLIVIISCKNESFLAKFNENQNSFSSWIFTLSSLIKEGDFYFGIEVTCKEDMTLMDEIREFAKIHLYPCVAFPKIRYLTKDDAIIIDIVEAISLGKTIENKKKTGMEYFLPLKDLKKIYKVEEIENTNIILKKSQFTFQNKRGEMLSLYENSNEVIKNLTFKALKEKSLEDEQHLNRLNHELKIISSLGYSDYFLLVSDYVSFAKNNDILVGAGRGSAAGSLVSYLLNITEIDPLEYDLQFERFLNPFRKSMPDIDVDFMDTRRDEVINYIKEKYGKDKVSNIIAFQTIQAKQALRDIGRIYQYPERYITLLSKSLTNPKFTLGQSYKYLEPFKKLVDSDPYFKEFVSLAGKIEGLPRQEGMHAAGVILNNISIDEALPVTIDFNDNLISQYEGKYLEAQGFLKMDFLGLRNLTVVAEALNLINIRHNLHLSWNDLSYKDQEIYELISRGDNIGLFQIETKAMKRGIQIIKPSCFDDLVALLAINRPGPMQFINEYALRRDKKSKITYLDDCLIDILKPTYGIILYQEQINQIAIQMAGFSLGEADLFRRAISKKDKQALINSENSFIEGAFKLGHSKEKAKKVFDHIYRFADYGFNKSHSVVYAVLTAKMAYLKAHYPLEFYTALLTHGSSSEAKLNEYIKEMKNNNVILVAPNINYSEKGFTIKEEKLLFPLSMIKGLFDTAVDAILYERKQNGLFKDYFDFIIRMHPYKVSESSFRKLIDAGALDCLYSSRSSMNLSLKSAMQFATLNYNEDGQLNLGISSFIPPRMLNAEDDALENLQKEYDALGIMLSSNPLIYLQDIINQYQYTEISSLDENIDTTIIGMIRSVKVINTKKGGQMAFVSLFDASGDIEVTIFQKLYNEVHLLLEKNAVVIVKGHLENRNETLSFNAETLQLLEEQNG